MLNGGFPHIYFPLGFNLFVRPCDRVFFVSRYSKPDGEHNGRESGQVLLGRFRIYEDAVYRDLSESGA